MRQPADALVLAGGRSDPALTGAALPKAFAPLAGRTMVEFVLDALRGSPAVGRIALVGPARLPPRVAARVDVAVPEQGGLVENITAGLGALGGDRAVLAAAADIPLITSRAVDAFLEAASAIDADIGYGVVPRDDVVRRFPLARKTFVRFREGVFTGGSLVLMRPQAFIRARAAIERAIRARKRPWELARLFGPGTLLGLLAGRLEIAALERRVAGIAGISARAVVSHDPEIGLDVDRPENLAVIARYLDGETPRARAGAGEPPSR